MVSIIEANNTDTLYGYLYGDLSGKMILYSNIAASSLVGPMLMIGIVIFEMLGGDSHKRTIVNRLLSAILINIVLWSVLRGIIRTVRDVAGLLDMNLSLFLRISAQFFINAIYIFYNALTISRYLFIVVWKRMRGVQDKFWSWLFYLSAYSLSFWINTVFMMTGYHPDQGLLICVTAETQENVDLNNKNLTNSNR